MATLEKLDGFEHGLVGTGELGPYDAVVGTPTIVTTPVNTGSRALHINPSASTVRVTYNLPAGIRNAAQSLYVRFETLPSEDVVLAQFTSGQADGLLFWDVGTGQFSVFTSTDSQHRAMGPSVAADTWYLIDLEFDSSTTTFVTKGKVDGGTEVTSSGTSTAVDLDGVGLGCHSQTETYDAYFDDWLISVTGGDYPIGAHSVVSLIPSSDGTHNIATSGDFDSFTTTAFSNATTNGNTFIAHRPLQLANTANQVVRQDLGSTTDYMEFLLENLPAGSDTVIDVRSYAAHVEAQSSGASLGEARLLLSDNTEVLTTGSLSVVDSTEDPAISIDLNKRMCIRPSGGWDRTKVDGLKCRVGFGDGAPDVNFIDFMVEVALLTASGNATANPSTVAATGAVPAATGQGAGTASPSVVGATAAIPAASGQGGGIGSASTVAGIGAVPAPTSTGTAEASPATTVGTASVPTVTAEGAGVGSPSSVAGIGSVPPATATGTSGGNAQADPGTVAGVGAVPSASASGDGTGSPSTVTGVGSVPSPNGQGAAVASPTVVAAIASIPSIVASGSGVGSPITVAALLTIPAPSSSGDGVASPTTIAAIVVVPVVTASGTGGVLVFVSEGDLSQTPPGALEGDPSVNVGTLEGVLGTSAGGSGLEGG